MLYLVDIAHSFCLYHSVPALINGILEMTDCLDGQLRASGAGLETATPPSIAYQHISYTDHIAASGKLNPQNIRRITEVKRIKSGWTRVGCLDLSELPGFFERNASLAAAAIKIN
jgi:hypothetical protein